MRDRLMYIFVSGSFKKITAVFSQREEWYLNPAFWFEWQLVVSLILNYILHFILLSVWHHNHFWFLHILLSNFSVSLGTCFSSFVSYMFWEQYRKCCLQECEVLLQFAGMCSLIGNTRLGFSMCPVKWRRCSCACCPLGLASFALFTNLRL